jgi:hypothetical protein
MNMRTVKSQLNWYFNHSDAALGFHSGHSAFISAMWSANHIVECNFEPTDKILKQIKKHRLMYQALQQLPMAQYRQLTAIYIQEYQHRYPPIITRFFQEKTGVLLTLYNDLSTLQNICLKRYHQTLSDPEEKQFQEMESRTNMAYDKAHRHLQYILTGKVQV